MEKQSHLSLTLAFHELPHLSRREAICRAIPIIGGGGRGGGLKLIVAERSEALNSGSRARLVFVCMYVANASGMQLV